MKTHEYLEQSKDRKEWLVKPLIGLGHNAVMVGARGSGKSWLSWFIAAAVATGNPIFGLETFKMPALLIDEESPENDFVNRMEKVVGDEDLEIHTFPRPEDRGFNFGNQRWIQRLEEKLKSLKTEYLLLVIDNLNATQGSLKVEESNVAVSELRRLFTRFRQIVPGVVSRCRSCNYSSFQQFTNHQVFTSIAD